MNHAFRAGLPVFLLALTAGQGASAAESDPRSMLERGRHLVLIAGCNDCHTPGFAEANGQIETERWLTGTSIGFAGPWGTTYPSNLRLSVRNYSEQEWLAHARSAMRPPMPSPSLAAMTDDELRAIHRFIHSLGPAEAPAPAYVPPGEKVSTPTYDFVPRMPAGKP